MMRATTLRRLINLWPPFLFAGIRVLELDPGFRYVRVRLQCGLLNRNYVGPHFGGSLFAMTDPFWMLLMLRRLGPGYVVCDRSASIKFLKAGREPVYAEFLLTDQQVSEIQDASQNGTPVNPWFETSVSTASGEVIARVRKQLHVRLKRTRTGVRTPVNRLPDPVFHNTIEWLSQ